jgi:hypothetical protein
MRKWFIATLIMGLFLSVAPVAGSLFRTCTVYVKEDLTRDCSRFFPCATTDCERIRYPVYKCVFNPLDQCTEGPGYVVGVAQKLRCFSFTPENCLCNEWGDGVIDEMIINVQSTVCTA